MKLVSANSNKLFDHIEFNGRQYITSRKLHEDVLPTQNTSETNRAIRSSKTYRELLTNGHIIELEHGYEPTLSHAEFASLVKSNSYRPVMLIDAVAQKAIEHHFKKTAPQAVRSAQENAALGLAEIDLETILKVPALVKELQRVSKSNKTEIDEHKFELEKEKYEFRKKELKIKSGVSLGRSYKQLSKLLGCSESLANAQTAQMLKREIDLDVGPLLSENVASIQDPLVTPTEIAKETGNSARKINLCLADLGLQKKAEYKKGSFRWELTEKGKEFAEILDVGKKHSTGLPVQQIKWHKKKTINFITGFAI